MQRSDAVKLKNRPSNKLILIVIAILFITTLAYDFSPFGGNITFYSNWIRCGQKPLHEVKQFMGDVSYYEEPKTFQPLRYFPSNQYYCTPLEAEQAGLSDNSYTMRRPHLYPDKY